jgi:hypothetical protein
METSKPTKPTLIFHYSHIVMANGQRRSKEVFIITVCGMIRKPLWLAILATKPDDTKRQTGGSNDCGVT